MGWILAAAAHVVYGLCAVGDIQHRRGCLYSLFLCGWFRGMGWPPSYDGSPGGSRAQVLCRFEPRAITSAQGIPPLLFLLGMAWFNDWKAALYMPAFARLWWRCSLSRADADTPQSCGLPPIEEYVKTTIRTTTTKSGRRASTREADLHAVRTAKTNCCGTSLSPTCFVYLLRYGILGLVVPTWSPGKK